MLIGGAQDAGRGRRLSDRELAAVLEGGFGSGVVERAYRRVRSPGEYGSAGTDPYGAAVTTSSGPRPAAVVDVRASALGRTLVDGQGRTLYLFEADGAGRSECNGGCATAWPPYLAGGTPRAGTGVTGSLLGTTTRGDGGTQ